MNYYQITLKSGMYAQAVLDFIAQYCEIKDCLHIDSLLYVAVVYKFGSGFAAVDPERLFFSRLSMNLVQEVDKCAACAEDIFRRQKRLYSSLDIGACYVNGRRNPSPVIRTGYALDDELVEFLEANNFTKEALDLDDIYANSKGDGDASGAFSLCIRNIAYPFSFSKEFKASFLKDFCNGNDVFLHNYTCCSCKRTLSFSEVTLDHKTPLATIFNSGDWRNPRSVRRKTFYNKNNLQIMCKPCNSSKGSYHERYEFQKLQLMILGDRC